MRILFFWSIHNSTNLSDCQICGVTERLCLIDCFALEPGLQNAAF